MKKKVLRRLKGQIKFIFFLFKANKNNRSFKMLKNKYLLLSFIGFSLYCLDKRLKKQVKVYYVDSMPFGFNGLAIPPFGIFIDKKHKGNKNLLLHEIVHWKQFQENGLLLFLIKFFFYQIKYGYDKNPMEIEARFNESDFCKCNYTFCVKNGIAKTVSNPNFRKL
ncbi:hypothetical protein ACQY1Q_06110 [Tenacibaculum sp. TC6]